MAPQKNDILQGTLVLLVLKTLASNGRMHGYAVTTHIQEVSADLLRVEEGSLYPALHRLAQYMSRTVSFVIRSNRVGTAGLLQDIQRAVWAVNSNLPLANVETMGDIYERSMSRTSLTLMLLVITGAMALLLGLVGIYGMISYMVSQRTRDIGIRIALGAPTATLKWMFLSQGLRLVGIGVVLGLGGAVVLTRLMNTLLFGVTALDPATYVAVSALLVAAAVAAIYLSVRRVVRIDPMQVCLRSVS